MIQLIPVEFRFYMTIGGFFLKEFPEYAIFHSNRLN